MMNKEELRTLEEEALKGAIDYIRSKAQELNLNDLILTVLPSKINHMGNEITLKFKLKQEVNEK